MGNVPHFADGVAAESSHPHERVGANTNKLTGGEDGDGPLASATPSLEGHR